MAARPVERAANYLLADYFIFITEVNANC